jgi:hypothetical protein
VKNTTPVALALVVFLAVSADARDEAGPPAESDAVRSTTDLPLPQSAGWSLRSRVKVPVHTHTRQGAVLAGVRALALAEGEARLVVNGVERTVREGDVLRGDLVKSVAPGRMVLLRAAGDEERLVIVTFDARGEGRERAILARDPSAAEPPEAPEP